MAPDPNRPLLDRLLRASPLIGPALRAVAALDLPDWWLGAGAVAQTVWNDRHGFEPTYGIRDLDVIYFDPDDLTKETENAVEAKLCDALGTKVDMTNEARVHLWYEERFGVPLAPYTSARDAIATWPTTATSIGVNLTQVHAPFGLDDLFNLVVRPNKALVPREIYEAKAKRWAAVWPRLSIVAW